jgi:hypothetical protein
MGVVRIYPGSNKTRCVINSGCQLIPGRVSSKSKKGYLI